MSDALLIGDAGRSGDGPDVEAQANAGNASVLVRWGKFNLVGLIGSGVQFGMLFLLKSVFHLHYLVATAVAVETAALHNFIWHEKFTWMDRTTAWNAHHQAVRGTWRLDSFGFSRPFFRRLWRFHLANGAVSILGNLAIMKALVDLEHANYLFANLIAIAVCSVVNFLLSDQWVYES
jgi:putative flippase GtrA